MNFLTAYPLDQTDAWIIGVCIGIIIICAFFLVIQFIRLYSHESEIDRRIRRKEKVEKIYNERKRNKW